MTMKQKKIAGGLLAIGIFSGLVWAMMPPGEDPQIAKVVALQKDVFKGDSPLPRPEDREKLEELGREAEKLTPEQRMQIFRDNPPPFVKKFQDNVVAYFELPANERKAALDKQIDEWENLRKDIEKRMKEEGGGFGGLGRPGGGPGGDSRGNRDPAKQNEMRKRMLDMTTPQQRAMFSEYFDAIQQRRQERGMPAFPRPGF